MSIEIFPFSPDAQTMWPTCTLLTSLCNSIMIDWNSWSFSLAFSWWPQILSLYLLLDPGPDTLFIMEDVWFRVQWEWKSWFTFISTNWIVEEYYITYVGVDGSQSSIVGLFEGIYGCTSHSADHIIITWLKMTVAPMFWSVHSCELEPQVVGACVYCGPTCYRLRWFNTRVTCQQLPRTVCLKNHILLWYHDISQLNQTNTYLDQFSWDTW